MKNSSAIEEKIACGELNLVHAGTIQDHLRAKEKQGQNVSLEEKERLVETHAGLSVRELRLKLNEDASVKKFKIEIDEQTAQRFAEFRQNKGGYSDQEIINLLFDSYVKTEEKKTLPAQEPQEQEIQATREIANNLSERTQGKNTRYISKKVKDQVRQRASCQCEYVSPLTGQRCGEKRYLEFHHLDPFAFNGKGGLDNLKLYCSAHNKRQAILDFGQEKMDLYLDL